jgi:hypothetical protein
MILRNKALNIDPETRDLTFDEDGIMEEIYGDVTTAQAIRLTLQTWKAEFFLDETHGTLYERIMGKKTHELEPDEVEEVMREAIFQETDVAQIDRIDAVLDSENRQATADFSARLYSGQIISMEVRA